MTDPSSTPDPVVAELVERLEDEAMRLQGRGIDRGCVDSSLAGSLALEAADQLTALSERVAEKNAEIERLTALLNTPEVEDFAKAVPLEAAHQRERWSADHDAGKTPFDWFWLVGYLAQKAASCAVAGNTDKAKHHTISTAAALANWHLALSGADTRMRPGIAPPAQL